MYVALLKAQHVLHVVQARLLAVGPLSGTQGAVGEGLAAGSFVRQFQPLACAGVHDCVIAHHIAAAQAVHADLFISTFTDDALTSVPQGTFLLITHLEQNFTQRSSGAAGSIHFVAMMHFHHF